MGSYYYLVDVMKNPQAFPNLGDGKEWDGMTLLDYFAGQALIGESAPNSDEGAWEPEQFPVLAERVYNIAKAMLIEREKIK